MVSADIEREVIKTLVGVIGVLLRVYGTTMDTDLFALRTGFVELLAEERKATDVESLRKTNIVQDAQKILRAILKLPAPLSISPTARKFQLMESMLNEVTTNELTLSDERLSTYVDEYRDSDKGSLEEATKKKRLTLKLQESEAMTQKLNAVEKIANLFDEFNVPEQNIKDSSKVSSKLLAEISALETRLQDEILLEELARKKKIEDQVEGTFEYRQGGVDFVKMSSDAEKKREEDTKEPGFVFDDIRSSRNSSDIAGLGYELPPNIREVLKYRIRRKRSLAGIVKQLASRFQRLSEGLAGDEGRDLLSNLQEDQDLRRQKIRELLDDVRGKTGTKVYSGREEDVLATASALSKKWDAMGLNL